MALNPHDAQAARFGALDAPGSLGDSSRRLSARTHELAEIAQSGRWGRELADLSVSLPADDTSAGEARYARCIRLIAENAPLRILPGQLVVSSATLRLAAMHSVPIRGADGKPEFPSVGHTTLGFGRVLREGYRGVRQRIADRLARGGLDAKGVELLGAMLSCLESAAIWHRRHVRLLDDLCVSSAGDERRGYEAVRRRLAPVPENPPVDFRQAVQSLWFAFCFQRLCGNWSGLGRLDEMLGPFLRADLAAGRITLAEARELLAHFWINGCDWIGADAFAGSGDAQHYQNVILAGIDADGHDVTNEVTWLVLDVIEELRISDFPVAVRLNERTPDGLLRRIAEVQRLGGGVVSIYNEPQIIGTLVGFGYPLAEARQFANDGCWEIIIPGRTCFSYRPLDTLALLQQTLGVADEPAKATAPTGEPADPNPASPPCPSRVTVSARVTVSDTVRVTVSDTVRTVSDTVFSSAGEPADPNPASPPCPSRVTVSDTVFSFEDLFAAWNTRLTAQLDEISREADRFASDARPAALISMLVDDCIERGLGYYDRGARYTVRAPHAGGIPDTANSLLAIRKLVFEDKRPTLPELIAILRSDWAGPDAELLRRRVQRDIEFYGNDNAEADAMCRRVFEAFLDAVAAMRPSPGVLQPPGVSTFGREIEWRNARGATAAGTRAGQFLATNFSPSPGTDRNGPTAAIKSHAAMGLSRLVNGTALELKMHPSAVAGANGLTALVGLMRAFLQVGGIYLQVDCASRQTLLDAQRNPEGYRNLAVRIAGWSARFVTLNRDWQDMIIQRTEQR